MKRRGMYISRQLSFKSASFTTDVVDLSPSQRALYDNTARFWLELKAAFDLAADKLRVRTREEIVDGKKLSHPGKVATSQFWGCHQRFFRQMCMAIKIPRAVEIAKEALAEGKCVVIGLQTTGEARLDDALNAGANLDQFEGMKEMIRMLIRRLPTGDYIGAYPEDEDGEDVVGASGSGETTDDEEEQQRFLAEMIETDEEGGSDDGDSEDEMNVDGVGRVALPDELSRVDTARLRTLLRAANVPDQQCTSRRQLLRRLRHVERRAYDGHGPSVSRLISEQLGSIDVKPAMGDDTAPRAAKLQKTAAGGKAVGGKAAVERAGGGGMLLGAGRERRASTANQSACAGDAPGSSGVTGKALPKRRSRVGRGVDDSDVDSLLDDGGDGDDGDNLSMWQHEDPNVIRNLKRIRRQLLRKLEKLKLPENPLDELLHALGGPEAVSEMTGRKGRLVLGVGGQKVYQRRKEGLMDADGKKVLRCMW